MSAHGEPRGPNLQLRHRRLLRGWSQREAAEQLVGAARERGVLGVQCSADDVGRWERGTRRPRWPSTLLLCDVYGVTADQLGLVDALVDGGGKIEDVERRDFLRLGVGMTAAVAVDWQRLASASRDSRYLDSTAIGGLRELTWEFGKRSHSLSPAALLPSVQHHVVRLHDLARDAREDARHALVVVLSETAAIAGRVAYQLDDRGAAEGYYDLADRCAFEAGDAALRAQAYVGLSYLSTTIARGGGESDRRTLTLLDHAVAASSAGSPVLRAWALARRAEEHAARGATRAAQIDLVAAQRALDGAREPERGLLSRWGQPWLDGYRANVHLLIDEPRQAAEVNLAALAHLGAELHYQRSALLSDVARALAVQGDLDWACVTLGQALELARHQGVEVRVEHVRRARAAFPASADSAAVRHLDERLAGA